MTNRIDFTIASSYLPQIEELQEKEENTKLLSAVAQANFSEVKRLLALGLNPNCQDESGTTLLEAAIQLFEVSSPELITKACAIIQELVTSGASYTQRIQGKYLNIFDYAFRHTNYELLFALHQYSIPVIHISTDSWKQFFIECETEDFEFIARHYPVPFLLAGFESVLLSDLVTRDYPMYKSLLSKFHLLFAKHFKKHPIHYKLLLISPEDTKQFLEWGMQCYTQDEKAIFALHYLASGGKGNMACLSELLNFKPTHPLHSFQATIILAAQHNNIDFLEEFQKAEASKEIPRPPLHAAILAHDISRVEQELAGNHFETRDIFGNTAFKLAIRCGFLPAVKLLSACASQKDLIFENLIFATGNSSVEIVSFLVSLVKVDEDTIDTMFEKAFTEENYKVAAWIVEHYTLQYPGILGQQLLLENVGTSSISLIQECVEEMKKFPSMHDSIGELFCDALKQNLPQIASLLLGYIDDLSFFGHNQYLLYICLFKYTEKEFVEKVVKKFGISDAFFVDSQPTELLSKNYPLLFKQHEHKLFDQGFLLCKQTTEEYHSSNPKNALLLIAVCTGKLDLVQKCYSEFFISNDIFPKKLQVELLDALLTRAIQGSYEEIVAFFCEKMPLSTNHTELYLALTLGNENIIRHITQAYNTQKLKVDFVGIYTSLFREVQASLITKETAKETLVRTIQLQRRDFTKVELEEIALQLLEIAQFSSPIHVLSDCICHEPTFLELKKVLKEIPKFMQKLPALCTIPYSTFSIKKTASWFLKQIFCTTRRLNPKLFCHEEVFDTVLDLLATIGEPSGYGSLLTALQTASHMDDRALKPNSPLADPVYIASICSPSICPLRIAEARDSEGKTELFLAVEQGKFSEVARLLSLGADPNCKDRAGTSVLEAAIQHFSKAGNTSYTMASKKYALIQLLVKHGAFRNRMIKSDFYNIFDFAFTQLNYGLLFVLHPYYTSQIPISDNALNGLFNTCEAQDLEFIARYYPNLKLQTAGYHQTICHALIHRKRLDLLIKYEQVAPQNFNKFLHLKGSWKTSKHSLLLTALQWKEPEIATFLRAHGATFHNDPELLLISLEITKQFLEEGMNCNEQDLFGHSALHYLAHDPDKDMACLPLLLQAGADLYLSDLDGSTPLKLAVECENFEFLEIADISKTCTSHYKDFLLHKREQSVEDPKVVASLFIQAVKEKELQAASCLLEHLQELDVPFFDEDDMKSFYKALFKCNDSEFIEKTIKKIGSANTFLSKDSLVLSFYKHVPALFHQLSLELFEHEFVLCQQERVVLLQNTNLDLEVRFTQQHYLVGLMTLAICTGKIGLVERCYNEFIPNFPIPEEINRQLLKTAIVAGLPEVVSYLSEKILPLQNPYSVSVDAELLLSLKLGNEKVIQALLQAYEKQRIAPHMANMYSHLLREAKTSPPLQKTLKEALIKVLCIQRADFAQQEREEVADWLMQTADFPFALNFVISRIIVSPTFLKLKKQSKDLVDFVRKLPVVCKIPCRDLSLHGTINWLVEQIFFYCKSMNPKLFSTEGVFYTLLDLVAHVCKNEDYGSLIVALQVAPTIDIGALAFQAACLLEGGKVRKPSKEAFLRSTVEEQKQWLGFALVYRDRAFIPHCYYLIKNHDKHPGILLDALNAIQQIGVKRYSSELENTLATELENILQYSKDEKIKEEALKAYLSIGNPSHNPALLDFLLKELQEARKTPSTNYEAAVARLLGTEYEWTSEEECAKAVVSLLIGLESSCEKVRYSTAIALTSIPHEKGLLAAMQIVQGSTWDRHLASFGKERRDIIGSFLTFICRPIQLHENRSAMMSRILLQLVRLHEKKGTLAGTLQLNPMQLEAWDHQFRSIAPTSTRHVSCQIAYPPHTDLIRGISTRKGRPKFREAVRDLFRKGAGSSELTDYDDSTESNTWNKIGHIFASHNKNLYFGKESGSAYFSVDKDGVVSESALIVFPAAYYEKEYLAGEARLEREGTFNNVLYRGIPHRWIKAVYLPIRFKQDIELLVQDIPLESVVKELTSDLFKGDTIKELEVFRRLLKACEMDLTQVPAKLVSFAQKLRYFPQENAKKIGELLVKDGVTFATEEEIKQETIKLQAKTTALITQHYKNPYQFATQYELLIKAPDAGFKANANLFFNSLPKSLPKLNEARQIIIGEHGSFGLHTDHSETMRALLRVATLLYSMSGKQARDVLLKNPLFYGLLHQDIPLVVSLIEHNTFVGRYIDPKSSETLHDVKIRLRAAFDTLKQKDISFEVFCHMLVRLYIAQASRSQAIQEKADIYRKYIPEHKNIDFETFQWLDELKQILQQ